MANRSTGYVFACGLLYLASLLFLIGFGSPYWISFRTYAMGLWMHCDRNTCIALDLSTFYSSMVWFRIVQAFQCFALLGNGIACLYCLIDNCCRKDPRHTRVLEIMAGCSGVTGFISVMIYVGKMDAGTDFYSWGFALDLTGCIFIIISAIVIFITNRPGERTNSNTAGAVYYPAPQAQGGTVIAVQQGYNYPAQATYPGGPPPQYPATGAPHYAPGAAPQYHPGAAPQYPSAGYPQGGYMTGVPPHAGYSGANYMTEYSGAPQQK